MIKYLKHIFVAAIALIAVTGCQEEIEDTFSKTPVAPTLINNNAILMTENTMSEPIKWAWSAARFTQGEVSYSLFAQYGEETPVQVGSSTKELSLSLPKESFKTLLNGIASIPENASFNLAFYVEATDATSNSYKSEEVTMTVFSYGNYVSAVATPTLAEVALDINNPAGELQLLTWEPARLGYNEAVTYDVTVACGEGKPVTVATGLTETACTLTVDGWNELFVKAGATEGGQSEISFTVKAYSATCEEGLPSSPVTVKVTTYKATFPAFLTLKGADKQIPQSSTVKGMFECFVNFEKAATFTFADGDANVEYGGDAQFAADAKGNVVASGTLAEAGKAISVEAGLYRVSANIKFKTFLFVKIESMGMIGNATPGEWAEDTPMTYDAAANVFTVKVNLTEAGEYKYRANNDWTYAIDGDGNFADGTPNMVFDQATGEYNVTLDVSKHPYQARIVSSSFPKEEYIYVPGNHQEWTPATAPALWSAELNGVYSGFSYLDGGFKFTLQRAWGEGGAGEYNYSHFTKYSEGLTDGGGGNISMATPGFYYIVADVMSGTLTTTLTSSWGVIGDATPGAWDTDTPLTYDAAKGCWSGTATLTDGSIKFRADGKWDVNVGGTLDNLIFNSSDNISVTAGTYLVELYLQRTDSNKMYCTLTKQ